MALFKCGGGQQITYIYKDGKWNTKYPRSYINKEGTFTYNSDGSFTWKGNERADMEFANVPKDKILCVKFLPINASRYLNWGEISVDWRIGVIADKATPTGTFYYSCVPTSIGDVIPLAITGNYYSFKIYEIYFY